MNNHEKLLIALLRSTISGHVERAIEYLPMSDSYWKALISISAKHGVIGLAYCQLEKLFSMSSEEIKKLTGKNVDIKNLRPTMALLVAMYEEQMQRSKLYHKQMKIISSYADALYDKGVDTKVLKGLAFSGYYNDPTRRECGDCDCFLTYTGGCHSAFETGNEVAKSIGGKVEEGGYKHSHIFIHGITLENHHYITDFNATKRGKKMEKLLQNIICNEKGDYINNTRLIRPSSHFNVLMLIKHSLANFLHSGLTFRMVYDWAMILRVEQNNLDWDLIVSELKEHHMLRFTEVLTTICTEYLDLEIINPQVPICKNKNIVEDILHDTFRGDLNHMLPNESFVRKTKRIFRRYYRTWKYRRFATENYLVLIWNSFAFSSYIKRNIFLEKY